MQPPVIQQPKYEAKITNINHDDRVIPFKTEFLSIELTIFNTGNQKWPKGVCISQISPDPINNPMFANKIFYSEIEPIEPSSYRIERFMIKAPTHQSEIPSFRLCSSPYGDFFGPRIDLDIKIGEPEFNNYG